jgi:hypothetical protein
MTFVLGSSVTSFRARDHGRNRNGRLRVRRVADNPLPLLQAVRMCAETGAERCRSWRASDFDRTGYRRITGYRVAPWPDAFGGDGRRCGCPPVG